MSEIDNQMIWNGNASGHYEVYFLKVNDAKSAVACWIRYTVLAPKEGRPIAELWGFFFDRNNSENNLALKTTVDWSQASCQRDPFVFRIGTSELRHGGAWGNLERGNDTMCWDLTWSESSETLKPYPHAWMYRLAFPKTKVLSPHPNLKVFGTLQVKGRTLCFDGAPAQQSHLWGSSYADSWVWAHCNAFEQENIVFEGLSARVLVGPFRSPPLTLFVVQVDQQYYYLNSLVTLLKNRSCSSLGTWQFGGQGDQIRVEGQIMTQPDHMVGARYVGPLGERRWCHNTKVGDIRLNVFFLRTQKQIFTGSGSCAVEWVSPHPDPRVRLWV